MRCYLSRIYWYQPMDREGYYLAEVHKIKTGGSSHTLRVNPLAASKCIKLLLTEKCRIHDVLIDITLNHHGYIADVTGVGKDESED